MPKFYHVSDGEMIGGQEPQALGTAQARITASAAVTKGQVVEVTGDWTVGPAGAGSLKVCGIAFNDAVIGAEVVVDTAGFVKLDAGSAAITAGDKLIAAAGGKVTKMPAITADVAGITALAGVCAIAFAGCAANGVVYAKFEM